MSTEGGTSFCTTVQSLNCTWFTFYFVTKSCTSYLGLPVDTKMVYVQYIAPKMATSNAVVALHS